MKQEYLKNKICLYHKYVQRILQWSHVNTLSLTKDNGIMFYKDIQSTIPARHNFRKIGRSKDHVIQKFVLQHELFNFINPCGKPVKLASSFLWEIEFSL